MSDDLPRGRPSLRLPDYDYAQLGAYFVTICTLDRVCCFGRIIDGESRLNDAGNMVSAVWVALPQRFAHIILDAFIVMPNHLHGIVMIQEYRAGQALGQIMGAFKSIATNRYIVGVRQEGWPRFAGRLWQDNYFEHIIRNEASLDRIREYIAANPLGWEDDPERPASDSRAF
ncbi:MAG: transposase [Chloroflexi bacterium]|nr:MAG: transposase [Chloroflexota bacterium]